MMGKRDALKSAAIYGANAAGKSAVIRAFVAAIMAVRTSDTRNITQKIPGMVPFQFAEETAQGPCSFEFYFVAQNGVPYRYGFAADADRVHEEYLYYYASARPSRVFERTGEKFMYNQTDEGAFSKYEEKNTPNKLFLATATNWGNARRRPQRTSGWLDAIDVYNPELAMQPTALQAFEQDEQGELKQFTLSLLRQADINIDEIQVDIAPLGNPDKRARLYRPSGKPCSTRASKSGSHSRGTSCAVRKWRGGHNSSWTSMKSLWVLNSFFGFLPF